MSSTDINRVNLIGNLTRDPEIRQIPSGTSITTFSIANNRVYVVNNERREEVSYFNCLIWGKAAETLARYAKKGQKLAIDGRLQQRRWQDNDGNNRNTVEINVDNFQFLSTKPNSENAGGYPVPDNSSGSHEESHVLDFVEDDIPF